MPRQEINIGVAPTGAGGDTNRSGAVKINAMTAELYARDAQLGTASNANLTTSADDATVGRVLKVGDRGIGAPLSGRATTDPVSRVYLGGFDFCLLAGNAPSGSVDGPMLTMSYGIPVFATQIFSDWRQNVLKMRSVINSDVFGPWQTIYSTQNTTRAADGTLKAI
ncbi:hypothetical protein BOP96_12475 [Pseudomonas sp. FSL W5-0203]|uniref:hypothetical protein n=1 Tax=Pseudomonas sp. FSL W5-0203 TaxID=1920491 RepID=UPI0009377DB8|nr:hypothetical protein [Pseudomonas sp. FSL W5-0203]OJT30259.1 hypothetical protein BOP96_12475 [Pseudomonas sp. FSL W5-0203]